MKTNFQMLRDLDGFTPEHRGMLTGKEVKYVIETLHINEMDELALRNLRDFTVMYFDRKMEKYYGGSDEDFRKACKLLDISSGVCGVIDNRLWHIGAEV